MLAGVISTASEATLSKLAGKDGGKCLSLV